MKFGILGDAKIAREKLVPAMRAGGHEIVHLGRRDPSVSVHQDVWQGVKQSSYEDMLVDPEVEAVYNPLPNHLHIKWSIKAMEAGKHVLCEKPIAISLDELDALEKASQTTNRYVYEAFMVRYHPQWQWLRQLDVGERRLLYANFSYPPLPADNIRNYANWGGGPVWDIGCYCVLAGLMLFDAKPKLVSAIKHEEANIEVETASAAMLDYGDGRFQTLTVSSGASQAQHVHLIGTDGWARLDVPFNPPPITTAKWGHMKKGKDDVLSEGNQQVFDSCNQYQLMVDDFAVACSESRRPDFSQSRILTQILGEIVAS